MKKKKVILRSPSGYREYTAGEIAQQLKSIRSFVDFDYDLRKNIHPNSARKIVKYYNEIQTLTKGRLMGYEVSRPRKNKDIVQRAAHHKETLPGIKVAFFPKIGERKLKVETRNGRVVVTDSGVKREIHFFPSFSRLAKQPEKEALKLIGDTHVKGKTVYRILAGEHYIIGTEATPEGVADRVATLAKAYIPGGANYSRKKKNHIKHWMKGIEVREYTNAKTGKEFRQLESKHRSEKRGHSQRKRRTK